MYLKLPGNTLFGWEVKLTVYVSSNRLFFCAFDKRASDFFNNCIKKQREHAYFVAETVAVYSFQESVSNFSTS